MGVYETRSGEIVQIIDARAPSCGFAAHSVDTVLAGDDADDEPEPESSWPGHAVH